MFDTYDAALVSRIAGMSYGDGSLQPHGLQVRFALTHSAKQRQYFDWKLAILQECWDSPIYVREYVNNGGHASVEMKTRGHVLLRDLREIIYETHGKRRVITAEALARLDSDDFYAIWFADDGSYNVQARSLIWCTDRYSFEEQLVLAHTVNQRFGARFSIQRTNNGRFRLYCKLNNSGTFAERVTCIIPKAMHYKLGQ